MSKPTETPVKEWIKFEKNDILQSPRVVFSDIASPRPRQEEDPNDSFQLPLVVERARVNAAARKRQIRFIMFGMAVLLVLLLGMAHFPHYKELPSDHASFHVGDRLDRDADHGSAAEVCLHVDEDGGEVPEVRHSGVKRQNIVLTCSMN